MKKTIFLSAILLLIFSCSKDDNSSTEQEVIELKTLSLNINLPDNSSISETDLTISSLFSENMQVSDGSTEIESFDDNSMELTLATNSQGNIVMLSYFNPINSDVIEMNTESTALALIMLHPWSFDLTANAKAEALTYIKSLPEFESYKSTIENSISSGELNPLNTQSVMDKVTEIQQITFNRTSEYIEPLQFNVENSTATVKNVISSASYSVGLYDVNDVLIEHKLAEGLDKSHFLFQEFKNNVFQETDNDGQTASFNIPTDGDWVLKAKSGLSFDGSLENQQAAFYNTKTVVANVLGIFSTKLKSLIKNGECYITLGESVYNGVSGSINISSSLQSYSDGSINGYILTKDVLSYTWDRFDNVLSIIESCSGNGTELFGLDKIKSGVFGKILGFLDVVSSLENVFNSTAMLTDWIQYDKEIEYCFNKNGNSTSECELSGEWNFQFSNSTCNTIGTLLFNDDGTVTFNNPLSIEGFNEGIITSSYILSGNTLNINYQRDYDLCAAPPGSSVFVEVFESISIEVQYNGINNYVGTFSYTYSGDGVITCNLQTPNCSGDTTISK
jgi:hypothetical protein